MGNDEWIKNYIDLLLQRREREALELKASHYPESLYKYRILNNYTIDCLERNSVWTPNAGDLNDPFESSLSINWIQFSRQFFERTDFAKEFKSQYNKDITDQEVATILQDPSPFECFQRICQVKNIVSDFSNGDAQRRLLFATYLKSIKREIRICSFSERNDSLLMWSHYSDQHRGLCIKYVFRHQRKIENFLEPVHYTDKMFDITSQFNGLKQKHFALKIGSITKSLDWQYEKEWRLTFPAGEDDQNNRYFRVPKPVGIFLGARFDDNELSLKNKLHQVAELLEIPIYKMKIHDSEYRIISM